MTEIDAIKNAQRLYHIIQAIARSLDCGLSFHIAP